MPGGPGAERREDHDHNARYEADRANAVSGGSASRLW